MCRHAVFVVPAEPQSAPSARQFCRLTLLGWDLPELVDDLLVLVSELVTNGVLHARTALRVELSTANGIAEVAVFDNNVHLPTARPRREDLHADLDLVVATGRDLHDVDDRDPRLHVGEAGSIVGGRGLELVASLADDWGVTRTDDGKAVWARLPGPHGWPPAASCPCLTGSIKLASGRPVVHSAVG